MDARNGWWLVALMIAGASARVTAQDPRAEALEASQEAQWVTKWSVHGWLAALDVMRAADVITRHGSDEARIAELRRARHALRGCAQNVSAARIRGRFIAPTEAARVEGPGRFDARFVARMIRTRQAALRACYERELQSAPTLAGTVVLAIRIEENGSVAVTVLPESMFLNAAVQGCVGDIAARFRFAPGPEGGPFTVVMTLGFEPHRP